jgi:hypothetical protein
MVTVESASAGDRLAVRDTAVGWLAATTALGVARSVSLTVSLDYPVSGAGESSCRDREGDGRDHHEPPMIDGMQDPVHSSGLDRPGYVLISSAALLDGKTTSEALDGIYAGFSVESKLSPVAHSYRDAP